MNSNETKEHITNYLSAIEFFHQVFEDYYGICNPLRAYRSGLLKQNGNIKYDEINIDYRFHGIGCEITDKNGKRVIDFDYGPENRTDGFDPWKLSRYLKSLGITEVGLNDLKLLFEALEMNDELIGPKNHNLDSNLYYLTRSII